MKQITAQHWARSPKVTDSRGIVSPARFVPWRVDSDPGETAGLGPFRLSAFRPGERIELERNPHYWRTDSEGAPIPYLDELFFLFVPNSYAQVLRFQAGEAHIIDRCQGTPSFATLVNTYFDDPIDVC